MVDQLLIRARNRVPVLTTDSQGRYPLLRLQTGILFPGSVLTIPLRSPDNLRMLAAHAGNGGELVAAYSPFQSASGDLAPVHQVGVFAALRDCQDGPGGAKVVTLEGLRRAVIVEVLAVEPCLTVSAVEVQSAKLTTRHIRERMDKAVALLTRLTQLDPSYSPELVHVLDVYRDDPSALADHVASVFHFSLATKQDLLEAVSLRLRYACLLEVLQAELTRASSVAAVEAARLTPAPVEPTYRRSTAIPGLTRDEDSFAEDEAGRLRRIVAEWPRLPEDVVSRATIEIDRLCRLPTASAEYGVTKNYLDWILSLPWSRRKPENYDIDDVTRTINMHYYGPSVIRQKILERLSVRKLAGGVDDGPALCLVGAPGTGKASLAKAIAKALGKDFLRISVGGISDVTEIKGSPRTFLGALPGKIIRSLKGVASCDPVVLIDDIDYFNIDNDSSVNQALLEVVDSRLNNRFLDDYVGIPFDLSNVLFICSVRSFEELPEQFVPRLELLEIPGYIEREKIAISKKHIIPQLLRKHGIRKSELRMSDKTLSRIIGSYTQEAGLLGFSQQIEKICRKVAFDKVTKLRSSWTISEKNLEAYLGPSLFIPEKAETLPEIGCATGLAWTGSGGDLMFIEGLKMKGEGQIISTGSLGEVMKESIQAAHSYVRSKADMLGIDFSDFNEFDLHIHFPSGAIPKDGPSAGVAVCLAVASVMAERPIRNDIAMTGEVTLRGRVLPVGGIKEKASAAYRAGIRQIVLPKENAKDVRGLPKDIQRKVKFTYIERVDELFELCLLDFTPSSFTLEKVFAEEIEKAKVRHKKKRPKRSATASKAAKSRRKRN